MHFTFSSVITVIDALGVSCNNESLIIIREFAIALFVVAVTVVFYKHHNIPPNDTRSNDEHLHLSKDQVPYNIEDKIHILRSRRLEEYYQPVYIPPMAKPSLHASEDTLFPLMEKAKEFLVSERQVMLIQGDSGVGKSTFNRHLEYQLWQEYNSGDSIPLFIELATINEPTKDLIQERLKEFNFTEIQIQGILQHRQLILICDGYDESQLKCNLHTTNCLNQLCQQSTKLIITCRSQYLGPDYRDQFVPKARDQYHQPADHLFQECNISPFSRDQIEKYIEQYISFEPRTWTQSEYMEMLENIPDLLDLAKNPFLLTLSLVTLPYIVRDKTIVSGLRVTRIRLYDSFVSDWLTRNKRRLQDVRMNDKEKESLEFLRDDGFEANGIVFQADLAAAIFQKQEGRSIISYSHLKDKNTWKALFFGPDPEKRLLRDASLLCRSGTRYQFVHQSILEFFYSFHVWTATLRENPLDPQINSNSICMTSFNDDHPLSQQNLVEKHSIIQFLSEWVNEDIEFGQKLIEIVGHSKCNEHIAQASANAITILVKAGVRFNNQDLRGIRIPGADLNGGEFDSAQLQDADLTNVNFTKSWVRQADFTGAIMNGVRFGEQPYIEFNPDIGIFSCAYSPNGKKFAVGFDSGQIIVYDTEFWRPIHFFDGNSASNSNIAFSPSGDYILSGYYDTKARLWSCSTESVDCILEGHDGIISSVAFSPCGQQITTASSDGAIRMWDIKLRAIIFVLSVPSDDVKDIKGLAYSPDGKSIALADGSAIRIFDTQTGQAGLTMAYEFSELSSRNTLAYSPDGTRIFLGCGNGNLLQWESSSGRRARHWESNDIPITGIAISPNGQYVATSSFDGSIRLWDARTGKYISSFTGHDYGARCVAFSPNSLQLASCGLWDSILRFWNMSTVDKRFNNEQHFDGVINVLYTSDGKSVISGRRAGKLRQYSALSGMLEWSITSKLFYSHHIAIVLDNFRIAATGGSDFVLVWSPKLGQPLFKLVGHKGRVNDVAFSPCGRWIATSSYDNTLRLWDASSGELIRVVDVKESGKNLQFSPSSEQVIITTDHGNIFFLETNTGLIKQWRPRCDKYSFATIAVLSPVNLQLTTNSETSVCIWDESSDEPQHVLKQNNNVRSIEWSQCEQWIASGCPSALWVWHKPPETTQWTCITVIHEFYGAVDSIVWRPGALEFTSGCGDGSVRAWRLVETSGKWSVQLVWNIGNRVLAASGAIFSEAIDLSTANQELMKQRNQQRAAC